MSRSIRRKAGVAITSIALLTMALAGCSGGTTPDASGGAGGGNAIDTSNASGEVSYWLWESNQQPAYQQCADAFHAANPDLSVKITQYSWDDYWTTLNTAFASATAPDVFTNHLAKYPEYITQGVVEPLDDTLSKDGVKVDIFQPGLADLWVGQDGKRYGLPKDFDTVAIFYNKTLIKEAGVAESDLGTLAWNPTDGGTYEKMIAHLTVDANGKRGDEEGFDKTNVEVYGLGLEGGSGGAYGQTQWSMYSGTTGWTATDKTPWGTHYNFDKPEIQSTIAWWRTLIEKGYMPSLESVTGQSAGDIFGAGKYALLTNGSWSINQMFSYKGVEVGLAPTPTGPTGKRSSMYNGLADSIWTGSKNKPGAAKWVEFLASPACQDIVGKAGAVFPAIPSGTTLAEAAFQAKGVDVSAFTVHLKDNSTFLFPITDHASEITNIITPAMDAILTGKATADSLTAANTQVNALFEG